MDATETPTLEEVALRLTAEGLVPLSEFVGPDRSLRTLKTWCRQGRLEGVVIGRGWHTSRQAWARFLAAMTEGRLPARVERPDRAQDARRKRAAVAMERLRAMTGGKR